MARDHGSPVAFETLRFVTVVVTDVNDNAPVFETVERGSAARFTVPEEEEPGYLVGRVRAEDADGGQNGKVYYYIAEVSLTWSKLKLSAYMVNSLVEYKLLSKQAYQSHRPPIDRCFFASSFEP